jgi:predicted ATPase
VYAIGGNESSKFEVLENPEMKITTEPDGRACLHDLTGPIATYSSNDVGLARQTQFLHLGTVADLARFIRSHATADFSVSAIREPSVPEPNATLDPTGRNLAAVLDRINPQVRKSIDREVSAVVPGVDGV